MKLHDLKMESEFKDNSSNKLATKILPPFDWMCTDEVLKLVEALTFEGAEIRFIGGCVRDSLVGGKFQDIDLATNARPGKVIQLFDRAGIRCIPTGIKYGTVTAVIGLQSFHITTYRRDIKTNGRQATVEFSTEWHEDAKRRDFTINAMSITPDGELFDPFNGWKDLQEGRIRFIGDPNCRVREDVLRILRWFRFYAQYGKSPPDLEALEACRGFAYRIPNLSGERIWSEFKRLLATQKPMSSIILMSETGVIDTVLGYRGRINLLSGIFEVEQLSDISTDSLLRFAALISERQAVQGVSERLRLSKKETRRISNAVIDNLNLNPNLSLRKRNRYFYHHAPRTVEDRILLAWALKPNDSRWKTWHKDFSNFVRPTFPITGKDIIATGIKSGPVVGKLLQEMENWWIKHDFMPDRSACIKKLRESGLCQYKL